MSSPLTTYFMPDGVFLEREGKRVFLSIGELLMLAHYLENMTALDPVDPLEDAA